MSTESVMFILVICAAIAFWSMHVRLNLLTRQSDWRWKQLRERFPELPEKEYVP